jgi:membrane protease YdiL (CAAX protease family)
MSLLGPDFRSGFAHVLYRPSNPAGLLPAIAIFVGLLIANQFIFVPAFAALIGGLTGGAGGWPRLVFLSILPAGVVTAYFAWVLARLRDADPREVLALRVPALGVLGWALTVIGFVVSLNLVFALLAWLFGLDLNSSGLVEQGAMQFGDDPLYLLIASGLIVGAPAAEEFLFRGQIFAAISQTPLGIAGASIITSLLWAVTHAVTEPIYVVALLFVMGLVLCALLIRFGSLWVTIVCHAAWNASAALALYSMSQQ